MSEAAPAVATAPSATPSSAGPAGSQPPAGGSPAGTAPEGQKSDVRPADVAAAPPVPKHKVKVDGEEREVSIEDLINGYQTKEAGQKRLKELAEEKKALDVEKGKAANIAKAAKEGDYNALKELGLSDEDIEHLSIKVLSAKQQQKLEEERRKALDPEKLELEDLRRDRDERAKQDEQRASEDRQRQISGMEQALTTATVQTMELLPKALQSSGIVANRILEAWEYAVDNAEEIQKRGIAVTPAYIAEKVKGELIDQYKALISAASDEELSAWLSDEVVGRRTKKAPTPPPLHPELTAKPQVRDPREKPKDQKPRLTDAQAMRHAITGKLPANAG